MSEPSDLDRLCEQFGIAGRYHDAAGREHQTPEAARRRLLKALGVAVGDGASECESLAQAEEQAWRRVLPPVIVIWQGMAPVQAPLTRPAAWTDRPVHWVLDEEGGDHRKEGIHFADAAIEERRRLRDGQSWVQQPIALPQPTRLGYHRLALVADGDGATLASAILICAPRRCYSPPSLAGQRAWGLATQLHAVRSAHNWGIGDYTDLTRLVELTAQAGAGVLALNPLHALFASQPERCNPYAPSSRACLNALHIDVEAVPEVAESESAQARLADEDFQARLRALRTGALIDYAEVAKAKRVVLESAYAHFRAHHLDPATARGRDFQAFCADRGETLERLAVFDALCEYLVNDHGRPRPVSDWPAPYRQRDSEEVARFAAEHRERIDFFAWLQWQAHCQLQTAGGRCLELRLALGLCQDIAVGVAPDGADAWAAPDLYLHGVQIGAPPDDFSPGGQQWGVLPWHPIALREAGYAPFIAALRANMAEAGAVRIDHVAGLMRQFLIPSGSGPAQGAYLSYPFEELLAVLALESVRNRCLVIGEDLGTVPDAVREALGPLGVLSFRLLYFERAEDGGFLPAAEFEPQAVVSAATHDLPTLAGFWRGTDLEQRRALGLFTDAHDYEAQLLERSRERAQLLLALDREGLLSDGVDPVAVPELSAEHIRAFYVHLARTPSQLLLVQTADLLGQTEQVNLPGSGAAYPNWRQRQPLELENWSDEPAVEALLAAVRAERGVSERRAPEPEAPAPQVPQAAIPRATYRLQLHAGFGFAAVADLVPYLHALGVSHCYLSPYLEARPGSTHGYDVVAHNRLNPELGTRADYEQMCETLAEHGMGHILDMVSNHVGVMGGENRWWLDVLENGPASPFADFFDIDWNPLKEELRGKVLVPVLGDHYGHALDGGLLRLAIAHGAFHVAYYEHRFPIDPREYPQILAPGLDRLRERLGAGHPELLAFESLVTAFANLPPRRCLDEASLTERRRDKELHKDRLAELCAASADLDWYLHECLRDFNGDTHHPADTGRLHGLLEAQAYRLAHWRVAADEINYRRFFDINDLAALRMENADAREATHELVLEQIGAGRISGLRIDHPDGLYDPAGYFEWLQRRVGALRQPEASAVGKPLYLLVEKILIGEEQLPPDWPVHGTTGYDFAALSDALLLDPRGAAPLADCYRAFAGDRPALAEEVYTAKRLVMRNLLSGELHVLASELSRIAETDPHTRDFTLDALRNALLEVVACFPVYRSYMAPGRIASGDRNSVHKAVAEARRRSRVADRSVFGFVQEVLLTDIGVGRPEAFQQRVLRLAMKFQQYTSPVTAKGTEDTAFYRNHRLVSLNEVGSDPERFGIDLPGFHRAIAGRCKRWPHAMLAGSTHDSKRSEDVRCRLHLLSELPHAWSERVTRWARVNRRLHREQEGGPSWPDANTEYLLYQTLLGVWPLAALDDAGLRELRERVQHYMIKAVREAKVHTAWTNNDSDYETALESFIAAMLDPERNRAFFDDFLPFQRRIAHYGLLNSLSQVLLRLTAPGVADIYQGSELWGFHLVDPDNRRPVDFAARRRLLEALDAAPGDADARARLAGELAANLPDGRAKLYLIRRALEIRRENPDLFAYGDYRPLAVSGPHADRLCAFARNHHGQSVIALAPRLLAGLVSPVSAEGADDGVTRGSTEPQRPGDPFADAGWDQTFVAVPDASLEDLLAGGTLLAPESSEKHRLCAAAVLRRFPVGLLSCENRTNV